MFSKNIDAKKMNTLNKNALSAIALILMLTVSGMMAMVPAARAHTPSWTIQTYAFLTVNPNPVGVGQAAFVNFWLDKVVPTSNNIYGDRWQNFKVTVTKPDGTTATLGPFTSDDVGGAFTTYIPTATGNYTFVFNFPGQTIAGANPSPITGTQNPQSVSDYYQPSTSRTVTLVVQQQQIQSYPSTPLPTGYWQRPIFAMNTGWYTISGNWLGLAPVTFGNTGLYNATSNFNPYTTAPNSAHILWTKPYAFGGVIGGEFGGTETNSNFMSTSQYEPKFAPIVMNGVLYYTWFPTSNSDPAGWVAVDLRTGQTLWTKNTTDVLRMGQIYDYTSPNQYGGIPYLWALPIVAPTRASSGGQQLNNTLEMFDAMSGNWILNIVNLPFGIMYVNAFPATFVEGSDGSLLGYYINSTTRTLNMWNSSKAIIQYSLSSGQDINTWTWRPYQGANIPWSLGLQWTVPMVTTMTASNGTTVDIDAAYAESAGVSSPLAISKIADTIIVNDIPGPTIAFNQPGYIISEGYSLTTGQLLWGPLNQTQNPFSYIALSTAGDGAYAIFTQETMSWTAYSTTTGQKLWGPTTGPANAWSYYESSSIIAYGTLYTADLGGYVNAYDVQTGKVLWTWDTGSSGYETPYGVWPLLHIDAAADGKLYILGGHVYSPPLFHGSQLWCLNATSGKPIWSTFNFPTTNGPACALADGYLVEPNAYDNQIYCFGKGLSATTVTATPGVGNVVTIQGTVTDQSPGQTSLGIPAKGTPAISDASMSQWMEYLYQQQPMPTNATGVTVTIDSIDPNNNFVHIGTATSDLSGLYSFMWTPPIPGKYTIIATFQGSDSYYSSYSETAIGVAAAAHPSATTAPSVTTVPSATPSSTGTPAPTSAVSPSVAPTPTPPASSAASSTTLYIVAAAAVIIIVIAAAALALRRRK